MTHLDEARNAAFSRAPWSHLHDMALGRARLVPTMLSAREQALYFWLASQWAEGAGAIVDLGCFAGGSTARLAEGARVAGLDNAVHAYDRFTAHEKAKQGLLYASGVAPFEGDDIFALAQELLAPWQDRVTLHRGEIETLSWDGGDIEILVMDASKEASKMDRMAETFLPHLMPGRSLLVQQDFLHWSQPWVPVQMELLADFFLPLAQVPRDTMVYLCTGRPDAAALEAARTEALSDSRMLDLIKSAQLRYAARGWRLTDALEEMVLALLANPGKRAAHRFARPAPAGG
ncbi:class I SAM-dependent methyltransferase [Aliiruegeria lutimaris]|uniref:Methyltransferase domain-containing protein n=1 Tax=Aliiruegeria lutimaris TaxID=571298 RepID=A0A1G9LCZ1_9RHOB|nr:class I SAM-dependent methyltransferase [Aliiruegeria lutimaris]SDL59395.1 hypothetical protein SAMN04488026_109613 [Aliiruegeria lutimaris]